MNKIEDRMRTVYSDTRKGKVMLVWKFHTLKRKGWGSFEMWTSLKLQNYVR